MSLFKPAPVCAISAGVLAATAVANQRIGLALSLALLLAIAAGVLGADRRPSLGVMALSAGLAVQPLLRDAGWVLAIDIAASLAAALIAVGGSDAWPAVHRALLAPGSLIGAMAPKARWKRALGPAAPAGRLWPVMRGTGLAVVLTATFGGLFATADSAFADVLDDTLISPDLDAGALLWRLVLGVAFVAGAAAIARAGAPHPSVKAQQRRIPGRTELVIALGAVVALFAMFVAVQLRVLFGGAEYVQATTGLGYGDYARQGFVQLLIVAALTLAVVAVAARRQDRIVRGLLGTLCVLTLVVLFSAYHRLDLVEHAYGFTRVRYSGHAIVIWLAVVFALVLLAGCSQAIGHRLPHLATTLTLAGVLLFSLSNPDGRIAQLAVDRAATGASLDTDYLGSLSADALPALQQLPRRHRELVVPRLRSKLARPDGIAGLNLARATAR